MNSDVWNAISSEAKDLTVRLLDVDPNRRMTIEEALRHPWIAQKSRAPKTHLHATVEAMKHFNARRRLKVRHLDPNSDLSLQKFSANILHIFTSFNVLEYFVEYRFLVIL